MPPDGLAADEIPVDISSLCQLLNLRAVPRALVVRDGLPTNAMDDAIVSVRLGDLSTRGNIDARARV
jgi:hypothetical protein